jgi:hypothetical protein
VGALRLDRASRCSKLGDGDLWWHGRAWRHGRRKRELIGGAHMSARGEREGGEEGRRDSKRKTHSTKYAKVLIGRLGQAKGQAAACGEGWASAVDWAGWAE